jgi:hypothetical protein
VRADEVIVVHHGVDVSARLRSVWLTAAAITRFPTDALAAAAGIAPSTRASGRAHYFTFRRGCNHRLRQAIVDFADGSRQAHPWAQDIYARARARGLNHAHANAGPGPRLAPHHLALLDRPHPLRPARHLAAVAARHPQTGTPEPTPMAS